MASQSTVYTDTDIRLIKWTFIMTRVAARPLRLILQNETVGKVNDESYIAYFKRNHKTLKKLYETETDFLQDSKTKLEDLDITLLYKVIRHGNRKLATGGDKAKWMEGKRNIESLITSVKDLRNELVHKEPQINEEDFKDRTEKLRILLTDLMSCVEKIYSIDVTQELDQVNKDIDKYRDNDIEDEDIVKYRFDKNCERLQREGKEMIKDQYKKMNATVVNTVNPIVQCSSPVDHIFSDLELERPQSHGVKITYQRIFKGLCYTNDDPLILLEGDPGVGKTTLVKKVISEWMNDTKSLVGLDKYILVLHHEFRNEITEDFNTLIKDKMPDIAKSLKDEELKEAALHVKSLIILDGLDEENTASGHLFKEVLQLKQNYGITVMITSRPEKLEYLEKILNDLKIKLKHICLLGIPLDQREAFVERYHKKMTRTHAVDSPDIENLKKYLEETKDRLGYLWRLPYNLTFLTILHIEREIDLDKITTAPELYKQIFLLYRTKLKERLRDCQETKRLLDSQLDYIIDIFLHALAKESIGSLMKNQINLQNEAYKRLEKDCIGIKAPAEQMIGAFLKRVPSNNSQIVYGYPHKGIQDYLSAQYIWMLLSGEYQSADIHKVIGDVFAVISKHSLSPHIGHGIMRVFDREMRRKQNSFTDKTSFDAVSTIDVSKILLDICNVPQNIIENTSEYLGRKFEEILRVNESSASPRMANENPTGKNETVKENLPYASAVKVNQPSIQESTIIRDILLDIYRECSKEIASKSDTKRGSESEFEINKFQNMLFCLLGMFYTEGKKVSDDIKFQALKLLQETGVKDRYAWLNVLSNVKCDDFVASFIASQEGILEGDIEIDDASLFPYLSLMKSLKNSPENAKNVKIHIDIKQFSKLKDLLSEIKRLQFEVYEVTITDVNVDKYLTLLKEVKGISDHRINIMINNAYSNILTLLRNVISLNLKVHKISITDVNVDAYLTVLKELKGILLDDHKIDISINEVSSNVIALLSDVNSLNLKVSNLTFETHFRNPSTYDDLQWQTQINQIMKRCPVERYTGSMTDISFSHSLESLDVSVTTKEEIKTLNSFMQSGSLLYLGVCVSADVDHKNFIPIHHHCELYPFLFIVNVEKRNRKNAVNIIKSLQPLNRSKKFGGILFPRCNINLLYLIDALERKGIRSDYLRFPSSLEPRQKRLQQFVKGAAMMKLGCHNVYWGADAWGISIDLGTSIDEW